MTTNLAREQTSAENCDMRCTTPKGPHELQNLADPEPDGQSDTNDAEQQRHKPDRGLKA
jgi:hypothetical protein